MQKEKPGQYEGFIFNSVIFLAAMFVGSLFPFAARTLASFFLKTPSAVDLKADGSYLFDVIYPIMGLLTLGAFLAGGFYSMYYAMGKMSYKTMKTQSGFKTKFQLAVTSVLMFGWNIYSGFADGFSGVMGIQFWYPAAVVSSLFGAVDKKNLLGSLSNADIQTNNFIINGLAYEFIPLTITAAVIYSAAFYFACYYGGKKGSEAGIKKKRDYLNTIRNA